MLQIEIVVGALVLIAIAYFVVWKGLGSLIRTTFAAEGAKRCELCQPHLAELIRVEREVGRRSAQFQFLEQSTFVHLQSHHPWGGEHRCDRTPRCCMTQPNSEKKGEVMDSCQDTAEERRRARD